jgi:hypothetical protein
MRKIHRELRREFPQAEIEHLHSGHYRLVQPNGAPKGDNWKCWSSSQKKTSVPPARRTPNASSVCAALPFHTWSGIGMRRDQDFAVDHRSTAQKLAEPSSMLADTSKAKMLRHECRRV